jgi:steroid delta-isomerase-like uncharacterized protein
MSIDDIKALFARREEDWARRNWIALVADYAEHCLIESPTGGSLIGRSANEMVYRNWFTAFPDFSLTSDELLIIDDRVVQIWTASGTDTGGFIGLPPTGKPFSFPGVFVSTVSGGQIIHERRIFDFSGFLLQLTGEVGGAIESARLYREMLDRARQRHELRIAAEIQRALLPDGRYTGATFQAAATSLPCRAIGGDFFDYFDLTNGAFGFVLGDVAGKGPPAALLTAVLQGIFAVHAYLGGSPAQTLQQVNRSLVRRAIESRFATTFYGILSRDGRMTYCNAGHNPPFLVGSHGLRRLDTGGLIIGAFNDATFEEETMQLEPGDVVVAFSDGITEALNTEGEEFGEERLLSCVTSNCQLEASSLLDCLLGTVQHFSDNAARSDDQTALVFRYLGS